MNKSFYSSSVNSFKNSEDNSILGELARNNTFELNDLQRNSWIKQISILKDNFRQLNKGHILFEYSIPRMGKRVDAVLLLDGLVFVLEFKVGEKEYPAYAIDQVLDYSIDLKNFHEQSHNKKIIPILISTEANEIDNSIQKYDDQIYFPQKTNKSNLINVINSILNLENDIDIDGIDWENSIYKPTPTIIEAAQALYKGHGVEEISRSDAGAFNLSKTSETISSIIENSKSNNKKSICFITGVPGSGKTLAGLNIANLRNNVNENEHAVFLSGNGPLVEVLQEGLARDQKEEENITKAAALSKTKVFIQNIHHFRDDNISSDRIPVEKVVIFDEAQRAWTKEQTSSFMIRRKGRDGFDMSEPEFLISVMDRHEDWATIICLIGGGQEINTGEAGLPEWFRSLGDKYPGWDVYVSNQLTDIEYTRGENLYSYIDDNKLHKKESLHLSVSVRSFRSELISNFVKSLLDLNIENSKLIYNQFKNQYPILLTRNLDTAKKWLKSKARGTERYGIICSSKGKRLRPEGIHSKNEIKASNWFLDNKADVRSSYYLEDVATEFHIQGLELDWTCVAWDANFRFNNNEWEYLDFKGTKWQKINDDVRKLYLKNAYRVLLTRARQGMIIFVPNGNDEDYTRQTKFYDGIYNLLCNVGIERI